MSTTNDYLMRKKEEIKECEKQKTVAIVTMYAAIIHCNQLTDRQKDKAIKNIEKLLITKNDKKSKVLSHLENSLSAQLNNDRRAISTMVEKTVEQYAKSHHLKLNYGEDEEIARKIVPNPGKAAIKAANDYIKCCNKLERLEFEKNNPPKEKKEEQYSNEQTRTTTRNNPTNDPKNYGHTIQTASPKPYTYNDSDETKYKKTVEYLTQKYSTDAKKSPSHTQVRFKDEDRKMLERLLGDDYQGYYLRNQIEKMIENGYSIEALLNSFTVYQKTHLIPFQSPPVPTLEKLLEMALKIYDVLPEELVSYRSIKNERNSLIENLNKNIGTLEFIDKYTEAYNIYTKYFNKLKEEEKAQIKAEFNRTCKNKYATLGITEFRIYHPDELKKLVNNKVTKLMVEKKDTYAEANGLDIQPRLKKATLFMSVSEIVSTYHALVQKHKEDHRFSTMNELQTKNYKEWFQNLQQNFAILLVNKLTQEQRQNKTIDEQLYFICKTLLKEEPLFPLNIKNQENEYEESYGSTEAIKEATNATVKEKTEHTIKYEEENADKISQTTNTAIAAGHNAMNRFFGMKKVEQTLNRINGKWSQFEKAWARAQQAKNEKEIQDLTEELNGMFRR